MKNEKTVRPKGKRAVGATKRKERLKPVSLYPFDFEEAMKEVVAVSSPKLNQEP